MAVSMRELYEQHAAALRSFLIKAGQSREDADDIIQDTMLRAWRKLDSLDAETLRPWLFTVARRIGVDYHRRRQVRVSTVHDDLGWGGVTDGGIERIIDREDVDAALAAMSPAQRRVHVLRHFYSLSGRETADALGITEGTVKSREFYGRRAARGVAVTR